MNIGASDSRVQVVHRRAILVLGMHRSGTSALAGTLSRLGVPMGSRMVDAAPDNPTGYWEHADAVTLDERLLLDLGRGWDDLRPLPAGWEASDAGQAAKAAINGLIDRDFADSPLWALKDPRLCRLLPLWLDVLESRGIQTLCLFMLRSPDEVAASLLRRDGLPPEHACLLWAQHLLAAERDSRGCRRALVGYDSLLGNPAAAMERVARALSIEFPLLIADAQLGGFLDEGQRHHRGDARGLTGDAGALAAELFKACTAIESGEDAWSRLAALAPRFEACLGDWLPGVEGWSRALHRARAMLARCESRLASVEAALGATRAQSLERLAEIESRERELGGLHAALNEVRALSLERLATIEAQEQRLAGMHEALATVTAQSLERLATIEAQEQRLAGMHEALAAVTAQSLERLATVESQGRELDRRHAMLEERARQQDEQARHLNELAKQLESAALEIDGLRGALADIEASLSWRMTAPLRNMAALLRRRGGNVQ